MEKILVPVGDNSGLSIVKGSTMTIGQFCKANDTKGIDVKESTTKAGHYFMVHDNGNVLGPVTTKKSPTELENPVVSEFKGEPTELNPTGYFFMLHEKGTGGAAVVARFE